MGQADYAFGSRAHKDSFQAGLSVRGRNDQVCAHILGKVRDAIAWITEIDVDLNVFVFRVSQPLENRLGDRMGLLSGGQRQAVSMIMAALRPMKILLLDEHTASLDPKTAAFVLELTREIVGESRLTTLMVTHSMRQALDAGERTVMLHQGRIVFDVAGPERSRLDVPDLLRMFERVRGEELSEDALLLG